MTPGQKIGVLPGRSARGFGYRATATAPGLKYSPGGGGGLRLLNRGKPARSPAAEGEEEEEAAPAAATAPVPPVQVGTGRFRMSLIPCGVAEEQSCGEPRPEESPADDLIPGEETAIPPGLGDVVAGEVEEVGPVEQSG